MICGRSRDSSIRNSTVRHNCWRAGLLRHKSTRGLRANLRGFAPRVRIGLPDDTPLQVGMSVEANIVSREAQDVLLVPANAVVNNGLIVVEKGRALRRKIAVGIRGTGFVEIVNGVIEEEIVASPATADIKDGARVRPQVAERISP